MDEDHIGRRIAHLRKLRHLTQRGLADRAHISLGYVRAIEQGTRSASQSTLGTIARALSASVGDLLGQPYLVELQQDQLDGLIHPIREALDVYDLGADSAIEPRPLADLAAAGEEVCRSIRATDLRAAATELPALIEELTTTAHLTETARAWAALATAYRSAHDVATKLGFHDLASVALDRMAWAAERASNPALAGLRQYLRSLTYLRAGQYRTGRRLAELGQKTVLQADPGSERDAVQGQLHLGASVLAARDRDEASAAGHIEEARILARATGEVPRIHWMSFGPTNVDVHHASILIEQDRYARALDVARGIRVPEDWAASRAAHHRAEIARALLWTGRADQAFTQLLQARQLAPQQTRYSPMVRQTVAELVATRRAAPDSLANYAQWLGVR
ncbi:helix-turn-helix domain-containing protein [Streptacidiphilus rugosus]|uniref:helix-turn-helix domain-containing protein n=1 Tax=Streptacidiphilus rugosus TaxID=405783 RepID=UPI000A5037B1|nr:helix-turn-helix transcriptional regulator [Streptacidiphilus rugosus]